MTATVTTTVSDTSRPGLDTATAPQPVRRARWCVLAVAAIHLIALVLLLQHAASIRATLGVQHPGLGAGVLDRRAHLLVLQSAIPHTVLFIAFIVRARLLTTGRPRARGVLTALLCLQLIGHATLPITLHQLPGLGGVIIGVQGVSAVFEVVALTLLWLPAASRSWFDSTTTPRLSRTT